MSQKIFQSAEDFNQRINMSVFSNLEKSYNSEELLQEFGPDHLVLEKSMIDNFIQDVYKITGGEIVKGKFNDTPEVKQVLEKAEKDLSELVKVKYTDEGGTRDVFIMKAKPKEDTFNKAKTDTEFGTENPFLQKAKDDNELEKGKIDNAFAYTDLVKFKKTGKEIKEKMASQLAKTISSIEAIEQELAAEAETMEIFPTEKVYQYGRGTSIKCPYLLYHWSLCDYWEGRDLNQVYKTETGTQIYPCSSLEEALPRKRHNELVEKWYDEQKELQLIRLFQDNFEDNAKYELNAEQMLVLGF